MPIYTYTAKKGPQEAISGEIEASSEKDAIARLDTMGLIPVSVLEKSEKAAAPAVAIAEKKAAVRASPPAGRILTRISASDIDTFTRQLASLIKAGIAVLRALALIAEQTENAALRDTVKNIAKNVEDGMAFSEAMGKYPGLFNNLYINLIKSGEKSGTLDEVLNRLAEHREREREIRTKVQAALAYPLLMLAVGAATVFVMLTYFMPKFAVIFKNMRQELPLPTKILLAVSRFMSGNWLWFLLAVVAAAVVFGRAKPGGKKKFFLDAVRLHIPFLRKFVKDAETAKFCRTMAMLIKNGISVHEALGLAAATLDNEAMRNELARAAGEIVRQGSSLSAGLKRTRIFSAFTINMIAVGEEGGRLEESLNQVASSYERDVEGGLKITMSLLEPALILIIGLVVGFIVFAMLLPIFNIGVIAR